MLGRGTDGRRVRRGGRRCGTLSKTGEKQGQSCRRMEEEQSKTHRVVNRRRVGERKHRVGFERRLNREDEDVVLVRLGVGSGSGGVEGVL